MQILTKIMVANRGESRHPRVPGPAAIWACTRWPMYSNEDSFSLFRTKADEALSHR